ncbi:phage antirepressor KilAC domain-containing protein [Cupriavidus basilensis]
MNDIAILERGATTTALSMTSREISELTSKEHRHVLRDIRVMLAELSLPERGYAQNWAHPQNGQSYEEFALPKDLTITLVAGYSAVMRHRIVKRWQELEAAAAGAVPAVPPTYAAALRMAADLAEQKERAEAEREAAKAQLALAAPKVEFHDAVTDAINCQNMEQAAKVLGMGRNSLFAFLRDKKILKRDNLPYQEHLDAGRFRVVEKQFDDVEGASRTYTKTLVTGKGLAFIQRQLATR